MSKQVALALRAVHFPGTLQRAVQRAWIRGRTARLPLLLAGAGIAVLLASACSSAPASRPPGGGSEQGMGPGMMFSRVPYSTPASSPPGSATSGATQQTTHVQLVVNPPPLYGVKAPNGQVHDAFLPATFTMRMGDTVQVTVLSYDDMPHTWTAPGLGVNAVIPAGSKSTPSRTTFTIRPTKAGVFAWYCATPCDPWSMATNGYMRGTVTVT